MLQQLTVFLQQALDIVCARTRLLDLISMFSVSWDNSPADVHARWCWWLMQGAHTCLEPHRTVGPPPSRVRGMAKATRNALYTRRHQEGRRWSRCDFYSSKGEREHTLVWGRGVNWAYTGNAWYYCPRTRKIKCTHPYYFCRNLINGSWDHTDYMVGEHIYTKYYLGYVIG